jgi:ABC-type multidrug transport system ATPase subunit
MSEEILKALTQLFAIITKQDGGVTEVERKYVIQFFRQELDQDSVKEYVELYDEFVGYGNEDRVEAKLTSVKDSVKTLSICKKINKTLTQKQKAVVLIRLLELVSSDKNFTPQRMSIIDTVSTVFNIAKEDYQIIEKFVLHENAGTLTGFNSILIADSKHDLISDEAKHLLLDHLHGQIVFLRVNSVDLYFVRYNGEEELQLNGLLLKPYQVYLFSNGSTIKTPKSSPIYYSDVVSFFLSNLKTKNLSFTVKNLEFKFPNGAVGLRDVQISEGPGKLIGIMGGSGAGKTTLLNVLAGIENPSRGEILINGINVHTQKDEVQGVFGYVAQDDLLIEELSVYENLYYNAKLCFAHLTEEELHKAVINVLASLGLEHIKDLKVGNVLNKKISGGQRKRLNIALELIREPAVMFVDEPTSGLSSRDSENVIDLLKELSLKGKLIFVVIHQPSSDIFKMFDKLFLLDTGGYPIYYGNPVESVIYFKKATNQVDSEKGQCHTCGNVNPEQIFNIIEAKVVDEYGLFTSKRKVTPPQWNEKYQQNFRIEEVTPVKEKPPKALNLPSRFKQTIIFTIRDFLSKISNAQYMLINLLQAPVLAGILALVIRYNNDPDSSSYIYRYNDNIPAYILVAILVALFMGLTVSAEEIIRDKKIQKREAFLNLSRTSYLSSKLIILFVLSAIQTLSFVLIGNWILEIKGMTLSYWMVLFTMSCFANILGLNISASFNSVVTVYITIPLILIPQIVLSGVMFSFDKLNDLISTKGKVPVIADFIASRWGFEALAIDQYKNNTYQASYYDLEKIQSKAYYKYTYLIPELSERLERSRFHAKDKGDSVQAILAKDLKIIREEISVESNKQGLSLDVNTALTTHAFDDKVAEKIEFYLNALKQSYIGQFNDADNKKERLIEFKSKDPDYNLTVYKNLYYNESLADFMKNANTKNRIIEYEGRLIQQIDPVYTDPANIGGELDYRAHFLAPTKHIGGIFISTYAFNMLVVWVLTGFLYITLYFETFKGALALFGRIRFDFATAYIAQIKNKVYSIKNELKIKKSRVATN